MCEAYRLEAVSAHDVDHVRQSGRHLQAGKISGRRPGFHPDTAAQQRKIASWAKLYHCRKNDEPGLVFQMTALPFQMSALRKTQ